jgi:hypothetical protein
MNGPFHNWLCRRYGASAQFFAAWRKHNVTVGVEFHVANDHLTLARTAAHRDEPASCRIVERSVPRMGHVAHVI